MKLSSASSAIQLICNPSGGRTTCFLTETFSGEGQNWDPPCDAYDNGYKCFFSCDRNPGVYDMNVRHEGVTYTAAVCTE